MGCSEAFICWLLAWRHEKHGNYRSGFGVLGFQGRGLGLRKEEAGKSMDTTRSSGLYSGYYRSIPPMLTPNQ